MYRRAVSGDCGRCRVRVPLSTNRGCDGDRESTTSILAVASYGPVSDLNLIRPHEALAFAGRPSTFTSHNTTVSSPTVGLVAPVGSRRPTRTGSLGCRVRRGVVAVLALILVVVLVIH